MTSIVSPHIVAVVVGDWGVEIQPLAQSAMELATVDLASGRPALAHVVEVVPNRLIGYDDPHKSGIAAAGERREKGRAIGVGTLKSERIERVVAQR